MTLIKAPDDLSVKMESQPTDDVEKEPTEDGGKVDLRDDSKPARRACLFVLTPFLLVSLVLLTLVDDMPRHSRLWAARADSSPSPLRLHVLPTAELLSQPTKDKEGGALSTDRAQFSALFAGHKAGIFVEVELRTPTDLPPNLDDFKEATTLPPSAPSQPPPPSPRSPPPPVAPSPAETEEERAEPWWVAQSRLPPRPKSRALNGTAPIPAGTPGAWAYEVLDARPGTVLVASPDAATANPEQPYFHDAVVLLVKVCGCHPSIFGVVVSSPPTNHTVGSAMCPVAKARYHSFVDRPIHHGGPAGPHWTLLHDEPLSGALEMQPGLYVGGCLGNAQAKVDAGVMAPDDITFFSGYAAWPIARLNEEVAAGKWRVAVASTDLLLKGVSSGTLSAASVRRALV